ncbi:MAG: phage holin family protein [Alphaproteobacteria bacterium]|nr:phage holin family protein [Alphaproteobacteria bacterium]
MLASAKLLEVAAQAELLRLKQEGRRIARNTAMMAAATLFVLFALAMLHVAAVAWIATRTGTPAAVLWVALGDAILAAILFALGRRKTDKVALEALNIRRRALHEIGTATMVGDMLRIFHRDRPARTLCGSIVQSLIRSVTGR